MNASQDPLSGYCMFNAKLHEHQAMYAWKSLNPHTHAGYTSISLLSLNKSLKIEPPP